jgi:translocation and assembly module TamA
MRCPRAARRPYPAHAAALLAAVVLLVPSAASRASEVVEPFPVLPAVAPIVPTDSAATAPPVVGEGVKPEATPSLFLALPDAESPEVEDPPDPIPSPAPRGGIMGFIDRLLGREPPGEATVDGRKPRYTLEVQAPPEVERLVREFTLLGRWRFREDFDPAQMPLFIRRAPAEIETLLAAEGYFEPAMTVTQTRTGARVIIEAGPRTTVNLADVRLTGQIQEPGFRRIRERVLQAWQLPEGSFFRSNEWDRAKRELVERARAEGFLRARVLESEALVNLETTAVSLLVEVDSGPRLAIGEIEIAGLQRYPPQVVRGLRTFRAGDPYREADIIEFQTRLNGSGYFTSVNIRPDLAALAEDETLEAVPIRVDVVEAQARRVTLGGGIDTDRGVSVLLGFEDKNVLDRGLQSLSGLEVDLQRQLVYSTLTTPYDDTGWRWQLGARAFRNDVRNDLVDAASIFLSRARLRDDTESAISLQLQYEEQNITVSPVEQFGLTSRATVLGYAWNRRRLDSPIFPTAGYVLNAQVSGASEAVLSDRNFVRTYGSGLRIFSLPDGTLFAGGRVVLRGEAGMVFANAREGIPSQNLFRTGGTRSVRGYGSQSLGLRIGEAVVGGRYLLVGSAEYQHPVTETIHLATFYDRGNAMDRLSDFRTVAGYGVGVRWRTPVGPLNFDVAYGEAEQRWRFHLSLGVVF